MARKRSDIDADIEHRVGASASRIIDGVEFADLSRNVGFEGADAENQQQEREQEQRLDRHQEVPARHQHAAEDDGAALTEHAIGQKPTEDRREIGEPRVESEQLRGERLGLELAEQELERAFTAP